MIAKALTQKDINTVLLKLYRKEKNCELIQGNVFYNLSLIDANYGKLSSALLNRYSQVTKYQNRIAALNALLYNKIYNLYERAMSDINTYNSNVEAEAYWSNEYNTAIANEAKARRNKEAAYSNYEAAEAEYTRIQNDYDQRISNAILEKGRKESELSDARAHLAEKQTELANLQQLKDDFLTVSMELLGDRLKFSQSDVYPKTGSSYPDEGNTWATAYCDSPYVEITKQSVINYILDAQGETDHFTLGGYTFGNILNRYYLGVEYYNMFRVIVGTYDGGARFEGRGGTTQTILSSTGNKSSSSDVQSALASAVADAIAAIRSDVVSYANGIDTSAIEADIAATEAQITQLEGEIDYLENTTIPNLRSEKAAALEAQQAVVDRYYNQYTEYKQQEEYYKNNKLIFKMKRDAARTRKEKSYEAAETSSGDYNDAKDEYEGDDKDLLPELPEPWGHMYPSDDEEPDPQDGDGGGDQSDDD